MYYESHRYCEHTLWSNATQTWDIASIAQHGRALPRHSRHRHMTCTCSCISWTPNNMQLAYYKCLTTLHREIAIHQLYHVVVRYIPYCHDRFLPELINSETVENSETQLKWRLSEMKYNRPGGCRKCRNPRRRLEKTTFSRCVRTD